MAGPNHHVMDGHGEIRRGRVEASHIADTSWRSHARKFVSWTALSGHASQGQASGKAWKSRGINQKMLATVTRQLATLIATDVRIEEALHLVAKQATKASVSECLLMVRSAVLDGQSFARALTAQPSAFPEHFRASVAAGEQSGKLGEVLGHLADFVEAHYRSARKMKLALLYPALLATVSFSIMMLLMIYVVPDIIRVFTTRNAELPFLTRALVFISTGISHYGLLFIGGLAAAAFAGRRWLAKPANRLVVDRVIATKWPLSNFSRPYSAARFTSSLASLVTSGVPLIDAIATAGAIITNLYTRKQMFTVVSRVREGASLNRAMTLAGVFPPMLVAIVASGENSGRLGPVLARAGSDLERDLDGLVATLMALIEPAVLLTMGGIVLLMVLAILLPIIDLNNLAGL